MAASDQDCAGNQIVDAGNCNCVDPCSDDSRPVNGKCPGTTGGVPSNCASASNQTKWLLAAAAGAAAWLLFGKKGRKGKRR